MVPRSFRGMSIASQARLLNRDRPGSCRVTGKFSLEWKCWIRPDPDCDRYQIQLTYELGADPRVRVLSPQLRYADGEEKYPHMYDQKYLCLHFPKNKEWTPRMPIAKTIVPWISDWLFYYESWLVTGEWLGGGVEHS